ncbi:MAG: CPXCG motif-containing cysteine-rich protein [Acidobacteriota bacterium]
MQDTVTYPCTHCGEINITFPDWSGGRRQQYIEDCAVCCQPNLLHITFELDGETVHIFAEPG